MIIGNGLMAKRFASFQNNESVVIFASGVSDSKTIEEASFNRERDLLANTIRLNKEKSIVYFSTSSVLDQSVNQGAYVKHKLNMERLIQDQADSYCIFRLSNVVGPGGNKKTVFNYLFQKIRDEQAFDLWIKSYRNIIDVDDVYSIIFQVLLAPCANEIINVASPQSHAVLDIVHCIESFLNKKAVYETVDNGSSYEIDTSRIREATLAAGVSFDNEYLSRILNKYYTHGLSNS